MKKIPTILQEILEKKAKKPIRRTTRKVPLNPPNFTFPFIIAEIKRASPSAGKIKAIKNPSALAKKYLKGGASAISVLCEEDYFKGNIRDLRDVKKANPSVCALRKDFITKLEQITESHEFGADMVLLIAAIFMGNAKGFKKLRALYDSCLKRGLTPLIEVHNAQEVDFIAPLNAKLIGVNSRNLRTFKIDKVQAYNLLSKIKAQNPKSEVIFESSLNCDFDGFIVGNLGFSGILCGSYLVRQSKPKSAVESLKAALKNGRNAPNAFYQNVFKLLESPLGFLKICGITNVKDALMCAEGLQELQELAQMSVKSAESAKLLESAQSAEKAQKIAALGFIIEPKSPRFVETNRIIEIAKKLEKFPNILKIVVLKDDELQMQSALKLYRDDVIDALQLHGVKSSYFGGVCLKEADFAFYEAWNIECAEDLGEFASPFVLLDSKSALGGGGGREIDLGVLKALKERVQTLCVAGGVGAENVESIKRIGAKMLDINSSIESKAGIKDSAKLRTLIECLKTC